MALINLLKNILQFFPPKNGLHLMKQNWTRKRTEFSFFLGCSGFSQNYFAGFVSNYSVEIGSGLSRLQTFRTCMILVCILFLPGKMLHMLLLFALRNIYIAAHRTKSRQEKDFGIVRCQDMFFKMENINTKNAKLKNFVGTPRATVCICTLI